MCLSFSRSQHRLPTCPGTFSGRQPGERQGIKAQAMIKARCDGVLTCEVMTKTFEVRAAEATKASWSRKVLQQQLPELISNFASDTF